MLIDELDDSTGTISDDEELSREDELLDSSEEEVSGVEDELLEQELQTLTREAVASLPEPEHSIFVRHYFLYQKTAEIAVAMDLNASTVRTKLLRGREKLKEFLLERGYGCEDGTC